MQHYTPLPELATAIRGSEIREAVKVFNVFGNIVAHASILRTHADADLDNLFPMPEKVDELEALLHMEFHAASFNIRRLLTPSQVRTTLELIYINVKKIVGNPHAVLFTHGGVNGGFSVTLAHHWLISCVLHPDANRLGDLRDLWSRALQPQPVYYPWGDTIERAKSQARTFVQNGATMIWPSMANTFQSIEGSLQPLMIQTMMRYYLRLGATAVNVWTHIWQVHGILRGRFLPVDEGHVEEALEGIDRFFTNELGDWTSEIPLDVRKEFTDHNFGADFLFLLNHVFPEIIAPTGSTIREDMFGYEMHKFIMRCATTPGVDPLDVIADSIEELSPTPAMGVLTNYEPHVPLTEFFLPSQRPAAVQRDVQLEAYGSLISTRDVAKSGNPSPSDICTICLENFNNTGTSTGENYCAKLEGCEHMFHSECLYDWVNGVHDGEVKCCNCRATICDARPRRAKP